MQTILAGRVGTQERADQLIARLSERGVALADVQAFYVTPPGQHGQTPVGGDQYADADAKDAPRTQATGAALGAVAGLAAGTIAAIAVPPLAPVILAGVTGVGALGGSVAGAVAGTAPAGESNEGGDSGSRRGGMLVAVHVTPATEQTVLDALQAAGAEDIERAQGRWRDGGWVDFDPVASPTLVDLPS